MRRDNDYPGRYDGMDGGFDERRRYEREAERRNRTSPVLIVVIVVLVCGVLFAGYQLGSIFLNYYRDRAAYSDLASQAVNTAPTWDTIPLERDDGETEEPFVSEIPIEVDWEYLASVNTDIVGWIYCPDTIINYPVLQHTDSSYYLKHGYDNASNTAGAIFADSTAELGIIRGNYIIYGHNMKDSSMFGDLDKYVDESYYEEHPIMYLLTPEQSYRIEFICCRISESSLVNFPTYFDSLYSHQKYIDEITEKAYWVNSSAATTDYEMVTLVTCAYNSGYADPRYQVHGILIPIQ